MSATLNDKKLKILRILKDNKGPLTSKEIWKKLKSMGHEVSDRSVRVYLKELDKRGLTKNLGRKGRSITDEGKYECEKEAITERVGFLSSRIDELIYQMDFNLVNLSGKIVANISIVNGNNFVKYLELVCKVFHCGYGMGQLITLLGPGEKVGETTIPEGRLGVGTVCSITINGILLKHGIPTHSKFGGLLEVENGAPRRFVEIIYYDATTLDPLEIFIRSRLTDYVGAIKTGRGKIGAGFREFPASSRESLMTLLEKFEEVGLRGLTVVGYPGEAVLNIPVSEGRVGAIAIGGLNPLAILEELGATVYSRALAGLVDYSRFFPYWELEKYIKKYL